MISIIGGGLSGLSLAYFLHQNKQPYQLFEATDLGGKIETLDTPFGDFESGANTLFADHFIEKLIDELNLRSEVLIPQAAINRRYILKDRKFYALSAHPLSLFKSNLLPLKSKFRILNEWFRKPIRESDVSVRDFFAHHFDGAFCDHLLDPFVRGIYGSDATDLDLELCFPQLFTYEKQYGSIVKGLFKNRANLERRKSLSFKGGLITLIKALAKNLNIKSFEPVEHIEKRAQNYQLTTSKNQYQTDYIVFACPAPQSAQLLKTIGLRYAAKLEQISYADLLVVHLVFDKTASDFHFDGFGTLYPAREHLLSSGTIWRSSIFPEQNDLKLTVISAQAADNQKSIDTIIEENRELYALTQAPKAVYSRYWKQGVPVYNTYLKSVQRELKTLENQNIYCCVNWAHRVSLVDCLKYGREVALKLGAARKRL